MSFIYYALSFVNYSSYVWETVTAYISRVYDNFNTDTTLLIFPKNSKYAFPISRCINTSFGEFDFIFHTETCMFEQDPSQSKKNSTILSLELKMEGAYFDLSTFFEKVSYTTENEPSVEQYITAWAATQNRTIVFDGSIKVEIIRSTGELETLTL
jgi:hypothetical protein